MKKIVIAIVAMASLCGVAQEQRHIEFRWHGVYVTGDASYGINVNRGQDEFDTVANVLNAFMPSVSVGYNIRKETGVGVGFTYVADPTGAFTQLPIYAELRSHFMRSQLTPYSVLQVGYCFPLGTSSEPDPVGSQIEDGGLYFGVDAGVRYALGRTTAVAAHVGYRLLQSGKVLRTDVQRRPILDTPVHLHMITFGATFYFSN